jgi:hypothetical protein
MGINRIEEHHQRPFWQVIVVVFISIIITNNLITLCNYVERPFITPASILVLLVMTFISSRFVISMLTFFTYSVFENSFSIEKCLGKKKKLITRLPLDCIEDFYLFENSEKDKYNFKEIKKCFHGFKHENIYCIVYKEVDTYICIQLKPERRIINVLSKYGKED